MTTIKIFDPDRATEAGAWASKNMVDKNWTIDIQHIFSNNPHYEFKFKNKKDAVLFALKWV